VKLLRTIQLDASDSFVFDTNLQGKARTAFRAGFLGLSSLGRSTLAQIVEATEADRRAAVEMLAAQLVSHFGAPDSATARVAADEEIDFAASLCGHSPGVLVAVTRRLENGAIREEFRTLRPREGTGHTRAFESLEVVGEDAAPEEHLDLAGLKERTVE
jgi:hypothetical protein